MAIRVRGNSFQVDVCHDGVRVRHTVSTKAEASRIERQAQAWLLEGYTAYAIKTALVAGGEVSSTPKVSMGQLYELACTVWEGQVREGNKGRAKGLLDMLDWWKVDATSLDSHKVNSALAGLQTSKGWSKATVNRYLAALSKMFSMGIERGMLETAPKLKLRAEGVTRVRWLTQDEEARILRYWQVTDEVELYHLTVIMLDLGLRNSEAMAISADNIEDGHLYFYRAKVGKYARLPMSERSQESLRAVQRFTMGQRTINDKWQRMVAAMGLKDVTPYTLRHTKCSRMVMAGVNLFVVKEWMGHSSLSTTERYAHLDSNALSVGMNL